MNMPKISLSIPVTILLLFILTALFAPFITPFDPFKQDLLFSLAPPNTEHWMGRDLLGRDIMSRVILGSRVSLTIGFSVTCITLCLGMLMGGIAGAYGGKVDEIIMRITDILLAFPGLLMAIAVMAVLGPGVTNVVIALSISGWTGFARITRAQILSLREREYVLAARALGKNEFQIIYSHYIPNSMTPLVIEATFGMAGVIVAEAGLSFLGLGVQPPYPSWGAMIDSGRAFILISPHLITFPGSTLLVLILAINLAGDRLRDRFSKGSDPAASI